MTQKVTEIPKPFKYYSPNYRLTLKHDHITIQMRAYVKKKKKRKKIPARDRDELRSTKKIFLFMQQKTNKTPRNFYDHMNEELTGYYNQMTHSQEFAFKYTYAFFFLECALLCSFSFLFSPLLPPLSQSFEYLSKKCILLLTSQGGKGWEDFIEGMEGGRKNAFFSPLFCVLNAPFAATSTRLVNPLNILYVYRKSFYRRFWGRFWVFTRRITHRVLHFCSYLYEGTIEFFNFLIVRRDRKINRFLLRSQNFHLFSFNSIPTLLEVDIFDRGTFNSGMPGSLMHR